MPIKFLNTEAIIFDMDGVLFLSSDCHRRAFEEVLEDVGVRDFSYDSVSGMRTDESFRKIFYDRNMNIDENVIKELVKKKRSKAREFLEKEGKIADGSREILSYLKKRYRMALVSSASPQTVEIFLKRSGYSDFFEFFLDGNSVRNAKPAPDIYRRTLQKLDIKPEYGVVIEDSISGVRSAVAAGISVIALTKGSNVEEYNKAGASAIISELKMLEMIF